MKGHNVCFYAKIREIFIKLSLLPLLIWSILLTDVPVFHKLPKDVTTEEGKTIEFYCDVMGDPPINVQWSKEDGAVSFGR